RPEALPPDLRAQWEALASVLPGVVPHMCSLGVARDHAVERLYVRCVEGLRLSDLSRLDVGIAHRVPALAHAVTTLTNRRVFLAPDSAMVGVRVVPGGWELKLELLTGALPRDSARVLMLVERALTGDRRTFRRWFGEDRSEISVVSVRVSPADGPALNVY